MYPKISHLVTLALSGVAVTVSAASMACSLQPTNPIRIKQIMITEIAHRLGMRPRKIPLNALTQPQLLSPLGLGSDAVGLRLIIIARGFGSRRPLVQALGPALT